MMPSPRRLPASMAPLDEGTWSKIMSTCPPITPCMPGPDPLTRHVHEFHAGISLEGFAKQVVDAADARRSKCVLAGIRLEQGDQLVQVLRLDRGSDRQDVRHRGDVRDRHEVLDAVFWLRLSGLVDDHRAHRR